MRREPFTIMALAAHHDRIGFCFLIDRQPMDWQLSYKGALSPGQAREKVAEWLKFYAPDVIVTEDLRGSERKGKDTQRLIVAMKEVALETEAQFIEIERPRPCKNKYAHIKGLCDKFPQMKVIAPSTRKIYEKEPHAVTIFEALALAQEIFD